MGTPSPLSALGAFRARLIGLAGEHWLLCIQARDRSASLATPMLALLMRSVVKPFYEDGGFQSW